MIILLKKKRRRKQKKTEADFFATKPKAGEKPKKKGKKNPKKSLSDLKKQHQKAVDGPLIKSIKKVPLLKHYMRSRFSLARRQYPHLMKF